MTTDHKEKCATMKHTNLIGRRCYLTDEAHAMALSMKKHGQVSETYRRLHLLVTGEGNKVEAEIVCIEDGDAPLVLLAKEGPFHGYLIPMVGIGDVVISNC